MAANITLSFSEVRHCPEQHAGINFYSSIQSGYRQSEQITVDVNGFMPHWNGMVDKNNFAARINTNLYAL